jgi:fructose-specific phosphotransferase system IIC component
MKFIARIVLAILAGAIATGLLDWLHLFTHTLNLLIGVVVGIVTFYSWDGEIARR